MATPLVRLVRNLDKIFPESVRVEELGDGEVRARVRVDGGHVWFTTDDASISPPDVEYVDISVRSDERGRTSLVVSAIEKGRDGDYDVAAGAIISEGHHNIAIYDDAISIESDDGTTMYFHVWC